MNSIDRHPWISVALLVLVLLALQFCTIGYQSYFMDEVEELRFAQGDFWKSVFMQDSMPPVFTLSLRGWLATFGGHVDGRWMSASLGLVSTVAIFVFIRSISNSTVGIISASLFAFSPLQLYYAQLIRGYALMTCVSVFCIGFFLLAMKDFKRSNLIAFTLFSVIGTYVHYYFAMIPIALLVAWVFQQRWEQLTKMATCYMAMFVFTCPVLLFLVEDFKYQHDLRDPRPLSLPAVVYTYFSYFSGYALGPSQRELQQISSGSAMRSAVPWLAAVAAIAIPLALRGIRGLHQKGALAPLLSVVTVPLMLIGAAGLLGGITYNVRFVAWFAFPLSVLFGFAFITEKDGRLPKWVLVCGLCLAGIFAFANFNRVFNSRYQFEDTRAVAEYLAAERTEVEPVFVVSDYMLQPLAYYLVNGKDRLLELPEPGTRSRIIKDSTSLAEAMSVFNANSRGTRSWLVYSRPFHGDPQGLVLEEMKKRGAALTRRFAGIDLYLVPVQP